MRFFTGLLTCLLIVSGFAQGNECSCTPQMISKMFTTMVKKAIPAVVYINAEGIEENDLENPFGQQEAPPFQNDLFNYFFGDPFSKAPRRLNSQGSGFFVSSDGYLLTNAHVVKNARKITITLHDERKMSAKLIGSDFSTDIAVLKVDGSGFDYLNLGDSEEIEIAECVFAIGTPFLLKATVTSGIISAKGRQDLQITSFENFLQTDTPINPGNSGGPLLNCKGEVIGINTAIVSKNGGSMGIGFAIPSNMAKPIMDQIIQGGCVMRAYLGIALQSLDQDMANAFNLDHPAGALVTEVVKRSPADKAGLCQGDIITAYDNIPVKSPGTFRNEICMIKPGTKVILKVNRGGKILTIPVVLGSHSDEALGKGISRQLGIEVEPLTAEMANQLGYSQTEEGMVISKVKPGSPAALAGMRPGWLILQINRQKVTTVEQFREALKQTKKNRVLILAKQGSMTRFYSIKVE